MITNTGGVFNVYTDLDCLVDMRRSILQKLIGENKDFEKTFPNFKKRVIDNFAKPGLNFTNDDYERAYSERGLIDLIGIKPTPLMFKLLVMILNIDKLVGKPINVNKVNLTINLNHYDGFDDELKQELLNTLKNNMRFNHEVTFVNIREVNQLPSYFNQFTHVFKYDLLLNKAYKPFFDRLAEEPIPNTKFIVPALYFKENKYIEASPEELIMASSTLLLPNIVLIPWDINLYNYI